MEVKDKLNEGHIKLIHQRYKKIGSLWKSREFVRKNYKKKLDQIKALCYIIKLSRTFYEKIVKKNPKA